ncbi:hypothetical protein [Yinghuangia seranimata]|uniref:hypothetical protein n=1 Tax=Yinghuangia seranimata TaxID=408067 RepID=UPI00248C4E62|nr:hypothetical protein [Yinghuangia seranimata]MDI2126403.1 hypothetical protein [Yinghuangia seranimata]
MAGVHDDGISADDRHDAEPAVAQGGSEPKPAADNDPADEPREAPAPSPERPAPAYSDPAAEPDAFARPLPPAAPPEPTADVLADPATEPEAFASPHGAAQPGENLTPAPLVVTEGPKAEGTAPSGPDAAGVGDPAAAAQSAAPNTAPDEPLPATSTVVGAVDAASAPPAADVPAEPAAVAPPRRMHPVLVPLMVIATVLAVLIVGSGLVSLPGAGDVVAPAAASGPSASAGTPHGSASASPSPSEPPHTEIKFDEVRALATAQSAALSGGNVDAFLAPYDQTGAASADLLAERRRTFANLRLIPFDRAEFRWDRVASGALSGRDTGPVAADVEVSFVHQISGVDAAPVAEVYVWTLERAAIGAPLRITKVRGSSGRGGGYPAAWDLAELVKADRPHVIMLAAAADQGKLGTWADRAEGAAKRDLELWKGPDGIRSRFIVFASPDDDTFAKAYGPGMPKGVVAFCAPLVGDGSRGSGTVVGSRLTWNSRAKGTTSAEGQSGVMRHEMGHALMDAFENTRGAEAPLWVVEGFAEYLEWVDRFGEYYVPAARDYVRSGEFTGKLPGDKDLYGEDPESSGINYHLAMTAIRYIADKYGAGKAFEFVVAVYREPTAVESALQAATGLDMATFQSKWAQWVKSHV